MASELQLLPQANTILFRDKLILHTGEFMRTYDEKVSTALLICLFGCGLQAQDVQTPTDHTKELRVLVGAPMSTADPVIVVPPDTTWTTSISFQASPIRPVDPSNLVDWTKQESAANGLSAVEAHPWHIVIAYDQFDGDGDNFNSGVLEEFWAGSRKFKRIYKSDNLNQTDYGNEHGLFRIGDQMAKPGRGPGS